MAAKKVTKTKYSKKSLDLFKKDADWYTGTNPILDLFKSHIPKQIILIAFLVILFIFFILNIGVFKNFINKLVSILMPIIVGFILTYLMAPLYDIVVKKYSKDNKLARVIATFLCIMIVLLIGIGLIFLFVPQLYASFTNFVSKANGYLHNIDDAIDEIKHNQTDEGIREALSSLQHLVNTTKENASNFENVDFSKLFVGVYEGFYASFKTILNIFVGIVVMAYTLNLKDQLAFGAKRVLFALCRKGIAQKLLAETRFANKVFSGFMIGKVLDSLIIGVICYVCCLIMKMPYTPLIAVIVGVTNIIPFFGPFIGAVPSFLIIILEEPFSWKPWGFLIFILILQQIDGNVIGPKILGDKTGVGSFWVLFSILLFGGLFGFVGMIIAVPLWAIISKLFNEYIVVKLNEKEYPLTEDEYKKLKEYYKSLNEK